MDSIKNSIIQNFHPEKLKQLTHSATNTHILTDNLFLKKAGLEEFINTIPQDTNALGRTPFSGMYAAATAKYNKQLNTIDEQIETHLQNVRKAVRLRESSDNYKAVNKDSGNLGAYQFAPNMVARHWGTIQKMLEAKEQPLMIESIPGLGQPITFIDSEGRKILTDEGKNQFLANKDAQEAMMDIYMEDYKQFSEDKSINIADYAIFHHTGMLSDWNTLKGDKVMLQMRKGGRVIPTEQSLNLPRKGDLSNAPSMGSYIESIIENYYKQYK
jgi:hypothetical protein